MNHQVFYFATSSSRTPWPAQVLASHSRFDARTADHWPRRSSNQSSSDPKPISNPANPPWRVITMPSFSASLNHASTAALRHNPQNFDSSFRHIAKDAHLHAEASHDSVWEATSSAQGTGLSGGILHRHPCGPGLWRTPATSAGIPEEKNSSLQPADVPRVIPDRQNRRKLDPFLLLSSLSKTRMLKPIHLTLRFTTPGSGQ